MSSADLLGLLIENSDPANLALLAVVWWRLDRRIRAVRHEVAQDAADGGGGG